MFARRLQIQERMTSQIAQSIEEKIAPQGVGVIIEARHLCMQMRGVEKQHGQAVTSAMLGAFVNISRTRASFSALFRGRISNFRLTNLCCPWGLKNFLVQFFLFRLGHAERGAVAA